MFLWARYVYSICGKANELDYNWPDYIDHQKPELNNCCLVIQVKWNPTGQMSSRPPAFALKSLISIFHANLELLQ